jgi:hypothetical protein
VGFCAALLLLSADGLTIVSYTTLDTAKGDLVYAATTLVDGSIVIAGGTSGTGQFLKFLILLSDETLAD